MRQASFCFIYVNGFNFILSRYQFIGCFFDEHCSCFACCSMKRKFVHRSKREQALPVHLGSHISLFFHFDERLQSRFETVFSIYSTHMGRWEMNIAPSDDYQGKRWNVRHDELKQTRRKDSDATDAIRWIATSPDRAVLHQHLSTGMTLSPHAWLNTWFADMTQDGLVFSCMMRQPSSVMIPPTE